MVKQPWENLNEDPLRLKWNLYESYLTEEKTEAWRVSVTCAGSPSPEVLGASSHFGAAWLQRPLAQEGTP